MATVTASLPKAEPSRLWQVPVFFLGAMTLAGVVLFRPYIAQLSSNNAERLAREARAALVTSDLNAAIELAGRVVDQSDVAPTTMGEAHFVLGSAYLERNDAALARHHFEKADLLGVPEADRGKLAVRLAKAWLSAGVDARQIVPMLSRAVDGADDPYESYGLLADAYQRLQPPDVAGLLEATRQQVARAPGSIDPAKLAQTRLKLGELLLKAQKYGEARLILARIGQGGSAEVAFAANKLLAKCHEEENHWPEAAKVWEQVRASSQLAATDRAQVLYQLGRTYAQSQRPQDAVGVWQEAVTMGGAEGQASAIRLAEMQSGSDPKAAVAAFAESVRELNKPDDFKNPLMTADELRSTFERSAEQMRAKNQFEIALELTGHYAKIAVPGRAAELKGQIASAWADVCAQEGRGVAAVTQWVEASRSFLASAAAVPAGPEAAYRLWTAAQNAVRARDFRLAIEALDKFLPMQAFVSPERVAEAWYQIGQVQENLKDVTSAKAAYQRCLTLTPPWRFRARYQLAQMELLEARGDEDSRRDPKLDEAARLSLELAGKVKFDDAEKMLQENLSDLRQTAQSDTAVQELTVYGLADVAYERKEYSTAEPRLKGALQEYPESPLAVRGRYRLALCVWKRATDEFTALNNNKLNADERTRMQKQYLDSVAQAQEHYAAVETTLAKKQPAGLATAEKEMLTRASFSVAELSIYAGKYREAATLLETLAGRFQTSVEGLHAVQQLWHCQFHYLAEKDKALDTMVRLRESFDKMPDSVFDNSSDMHTRDYWVKKLVEMGRQN